MTNALIDYYRCPEAFAKFAVSDELGQNQGFFRFGRQTCFGRSAGPVAHSAGENLSDTFPLTMSRGPEIVLPFDPDEIVENLRSERYVIKGQAPSFTKKLIRNAYYVARPLLPVSVRKHFQRFHLRGWEDIAFPSWPVDKTIDNLCSDLMALSVKANDNERIPFVWFWPDGFKGCVLVTHDIEHEPGRVFCGKLMDLDDRYGIRASIDVVPEERYDVSDSFLEGIRSRGFELNVHDFNHDGHLFDNHELFLKRANKINAYAKKWGAEGFRAGAMYRNAEWNDAFEFDYDMSVPNAAHMEPQRGGCCTVMPYFAGGLVELPLTVTQDYSLFHILDQYSLDLWKQELNSIHSSNGLATFNMHPDYLIARRERQVYENLLQYLSELCKQTRLWQPLPRDVAHWWRDRSRMQIVRVGDSWKVVGQGSERARIAYAQIDENQLTYSVENEPCATSMA